MHSLRGSVPARLVMHVHEAHSIRFSSPVHSDVQLLEAEDAASLTRPPMRTPYIKTVLLSGLGTVRPEPG